MTTVNVEEEPEEEDFGPPTEDAPRDSVLAEVLSNNSSVTVAQLVQCIRDMDLDQTSRLRDSLGEVASDSREFLVLAIARLVDGCQRFRSVGEVTDHELPSPPPPPPARPSPPTECESGEYQSSVPETTNLVDDEVARPTDDTPIPPEDDRVDDHGLGELPINRSFRRQLTRTSSRAASSTDFGTSQRESSSGMLRRSSSTIIPGLPRLTLADRYSVRMPLASMTKPTTTGTEPQRMVLLARDLANDERHVMLLVSPTREHFLQELRQYKRLEYEPRIAPRVLDAFATVLAPEPTSVSSTTSSMLEPVRTGAGDEVVSPSSSRFTRLPVDLDEFESFSESAPIGASYVLVTEHGYSVDHVHKCLADNVTGAHMAHAVTSLVMAVSHLHERGMWHGRLSIEHVVFMPALHVSGHDVLTMQMVGWSQLRNDLPLACDAQWLAPEDQIHHSEWCVGEGDAAAVDRTEIDDMEGAAAVVPLSPRNVVRDMQRRDCFALGQIILECLKILPIDMASLSLLADKQSFIDSQLSMLVCDLSGQPDPLMRSEVPKVVATDLVAAPRDSRKLRGQPPLQRSTTHATHDSAMTVMFLTAGVDEFMSRTVKGLLKANPSERFTSLEALRSITQQRAKQPRRHLAVVGFANPAAVESQLLHPSMVDMAAAPLPRVDRADYDVVPFMTVDTLRRSLVDHAPAVVVLQSHGDTDSLQLHSPGTYTIAELISADRLYSVLTEPMVMQHRAHRPYRAILLLSCHSKKIAEQLSKLLAGDTLVVGSAGLLDARTSQWLADSFTAAVQRESCENVPAAFWAAVDGLYVDHDRFAVTEEQSLQLADLVLQRRANLSPDHRFVVARSCCFKAYANGVELVRPTLSALSAEYLAKKDRHDRDVHWLLRTSRDSKIT